MKVKIMGKDLKGKELGRGLTQRPDGRYMARAQVAGKSVLLYGWKLRTLKKEFAEAVEEARKGSIWLGYEADTLTLNEWFEEWFSTYKVPVIKESSVYPMKLKYTGTFGAKIGTIAFLSNLFREILSFVLIPFIAKHLNMFTAIAPHSVIPDFRRIRLRR